MMKCSTLLIAAPLLLSACDYLSLSDTKEPSAQEQQAALSNAQSLRQHGNAASAITLLKSQPESGTALQQLGYAQIEAGQAQDALATFDKLIAQSPNNASAYNGKAVAMDYMGDHLPAQELYRKALALSDAPSVRNNLALSMVLSGQAAAAIPMLESLNAQNPKDKTIRQNLALAYGLKGDKKKANALNLQELTPEQAKENLRFYERLAKMKKAAPAVTPPALQPAAPADTPAADATAAPEEEQESSFFGFMKGWDLPDPDATFPDPRRRRR